ncbi:MAG: hypothetical protein QOH58_513 [Thermoleophilaceae bacterium]|nr:hypothetical protein [Thermoleophilaceae bacterium]
MPAPPYDEAYDDSGRPRPHYAQLLDALGDPGELAARVRERLRGRGVTFGGSPDGLFTLDPVPRVLTSEEWSELQIGVAQRLRALDAFVADVYGEGRAMSEGVVPRAVVESSPHYEPAMRGAAVSRWIAFAGLDVVRCPDGRFRVIEDQVRMPSGLAYAVVARETLRGLFAVEPPRADLTLVYGELALALRDASPVPEPRMVLLTEGPGAAAWWEHSVLARELCASAVTLDDLELRDGRLVAWLDGRPRAVDVLYQRTAEDRFSGTPLELLIEPCARGTLTVVNAPGSGVADDKLVHPHVDELVRFFLDEEPLLPSIRSVPAGEPDDLDEFVVKPRGEMGGQDVVIWRDADESTRRRMLAAIERDPNAFVAQELVTLSVHPTVCEGRLEPRHVDLRPYAVLSDDGVRALPGGLSRVALEAGSMVVNSGRGGGAKDTWVPA